MEVKAYWMTKDYTWKMYNLTVDTKSEAKKLGEEIAKMFNCYLNIGMILDYKVEY